MHADFSDGHFVFAPKGTQDGDEIQVTRAAGDVRPLTLKNSSNKLVAAAAAASVRQVLVLKAAPTQRGFVPGRQLGMNILDIDTEARITGLRGRAESRMPLLLLFDYAQAFPSMYHDWLHHALLCMALPRGFRNLFKQHVN